MRGFTAHKATTVTLTRGDETIDFVLSPLPAGYFAALRSAFPKPIQYVNQKPAGEDSAKLAEYFDLFGFLQLAKHLEPSGVLDTKCPVLTSPRPVVEKAARAIREEFRAAKLTDGEINRLVSAGVELNASADVMEDLGKSPRPSHQSEDG